MRFLACFLLLLAAILPDTSGLMLREVEVYGN